MSTKTDSEKNRQRMRTHNNQVRRYKKLIAMYPKSPDVKIWKKRIEGFSK